MPALLLLALLLPSSARADERPAAAEPAPSAEDAPLPGDPLPDGEGSLWDFVELPDEPAPDADAIEASEELEAARAAEESFLAGIVKGARPPARFYTDPVGTLADDPLHLAEIDPSEFDIPVVVNDAVVRWLEYFTGKGRKYYARWLARSGRYRPMIERKLAEAGLPRDLVYLAMIESGFSPRAYSRAAAVGLWQFIAPTARDHGLTVNWWVDERRDPERATDAAIRFLSELHGKYGDWYLAFAAYNGGPLRVERGIARHGTRDFWELVEKDAFRSETDNYVPKLLAAAIIGHHPERYGFGDVRIEEPEEYDVVEVGPSIGIDVIARCAGTTEAEIQRLNPQLRRWALPPEPERQRIRIPKGRTGTFLAALEKVPPSERLTFRRHRVRRGETLSAIARKYGVSVDAIQRFNRIRNPNRIRAGMELVIPVPGASPPPETALASSAGKGRSSARARVHVVRRGETLSAIAARYGVSQSQLMRWNGIRDPDRIYAGQRLKVYASGGSSSSGRWITYRVRRGDTLSEIAARHGCTVSDLKRWNHLRGTTIYAGQELRIRRR